MNLSWIYKLPTINFKCVNFRCINFLYIKFRYINFMCINNIPEKGKICGDKKGKEKKKKEKKVIAGSDHTLISKFGSMLLCIGAILHLPYSSPTESTPMFLILQIQLTVFIHMQLNGSRDHPMLSLPSSLARKLAPIPAHPLNLLHRTPILSLSCTHPETLCPRPLLHHAAATIESLSSVPPLGLHHTATAIGSPPPRRHQFIVHLTRSLSIDLPRILRLLLSIKPPPGLLAHACHRSRFTLALVLV